MHVDASYKNDISDESVVDASYKNDISDESLIPKCTVSVTKYSEEGKHRVCHF